MTAAVTDVCGTCRSYEGRRCYFNPPVVVVVTNPNYDHAMLVSCTERPEVDATDKACSRWRPR